VQAFSGGGQRLDGKVNKNASPSIDHPIESKRGLPNYNYKKGKLNFVRAKTLLADPATEPVVSSFAVRRNKNLPVK